MLTAPPTKPSFVQYIGTVVKYNDMILFHACLQDIIKDDYLWSFNNHTHEYNIMNNNIHMVISVFQEENIYAIEIRSLKRLGWSNCTAYNDAHNYILYELKERLKLKGDMPYRRSMPCIPGITESSLYKIMS